MDAKSIYDLKPIPAEEDIFPEQLALTFMLNNYAKRYTFSPPRLLLLSDYVHTNC